MTASASPAAVRPRLHVAITPSTRGAAANAPLTRVSLAYIEHRFKLYLRFGEPARTLRLDRWRRCAVFLPNAVFCRIRWQANDYGTIRWQLMVMQACTPLDAAQRIPGVQPGARLLLHAEGEQSVRAVLERIDAIEALGIAPAPLARVLAHARQPARCAPAAARIHRRAARRLAGREGAAMTAVSTTGTAPHPRSRLRARLVLAGLSACGLAALAWASFVHPLPRLTYNPSDSVAVGWYRVDPLDRRTARCHVRCPWAASCWCRCPPRLPRSLRSAATCRRASRCSSAWARSRRKRCASLTAASASTACLRPPCCLPTAGAARCHPGSSAAAFGLASCSCSV
jgi:hypothetical protein